MLKRIIAGLLLTLSFGVACNLTSAEDELNPIHQETWDKFTKLEAQRLLETPLLRDEQLEFYMLVEQKDIITAEAQQHQVIVMAKNTKFEAQRVVVQKLAAQITAYKAKNSKIASGTKAQKEKYRKELTALQTKYKTAQAKATSIKNEVTTASNLYKQTKVKLAAVNKELAPVKADLTVKAKTVQNIELSIEGLEKILWNMPAYSEYFQAQRTVTKPAKMTLANYSVEAKALTSKEQQLANLINDYRNSLGLQSLSISKSLTKVARTHINDSNTNHPGFERADYNKYSCTLRSWSKNGSWSDVCYFEGHNYLSSPLYKKMLNKPKEITKYQGIGVEIYAYEDGQISPETALNQWINTAGENRVLTGYRSFAKLTTMGVGIHGRYAFVWFGMEGDPAGYHK